MFPAFIFRLAAEGITALRENLCRPYGIRYLFGLLPGTSVPGFPMVQTGQIGNRTDRGER